MQQDRKIRMADLIKETAAKFILQEANPNPMITVTNVDLSPDFKRAIIFITTIPDGREEDALIFLRRNGTEMRNYFKEKVVMKRIPHLDFMIDAGERHRQHMDELVREIENK